MEPKKTISADLERQKGLFFLIGLFVSLLLVYLVFEFTGSTERYENLQWGTGYIDEEIAVFPVCFLPPLSQQTTETDKKTVANDVKTEDFTINAEADEDLRIDDEVNTTENDLIGFSSDVYVDIHGGDENYIWLIKFLQENLRYPEPARQTSLEGKIQIGFTVEKNGYLTNFTILRGVVPVLDNEVLRVLQLLPKRKWKTTENRAEYKCLHYKMYVAFVLK
jgi:protein TonB